MICLCNVVNENIFHYSMTESSSTAMSLGRSLLSLGLQKDVLAALTRNGYENLRDLNSATAEGLTKGKTYSKPTGEI